jgi:hypothetical protein
MKQLGAFCWLPREFVHVIFPLLGCFVTRGGGGGGGAGGGGGGGGGGGVGRRTEGEQSCQKAGWGKMREGRWSRVG